ncbi:MAG: TVP38/TMEM64 family protein [Treponema sp.]|jgi:uncharacterized membrane protein YdjX (TVP38/TMEM64 family)|nr:TVP38/TMEM64 family protein [Treponema sp.]MBQ1671749.1 TVP38/TMEM64 family protein [Treponema sp.]MBQ2354637.1 TVP38/TMEM64 family protein [Treponema sp.]MBQ2464992.1 TVP38/TMEM64 family protein [Treponema sp.]MBQ2571790.1 TVP38/TMEM64 family protein [Treponema sp.]
MESIEKQLEKQLEQRPRTLKIVGTIGFLLLAVVTTVFFVHEYMEGHFKDVNSLSEYIEAYGILGPVMLAFFQCVKVLFAIVPGAIGCIAGAGMFGWLGGFLCSYIGICSGSMIAFLLSKKYGMSLMKLVFSDKRYNKCVRWLQKKHHHYPVVLWFAICFPFSPDDFLCYFSGMTSLSFRRFALIILTAKPWTILGYSLIFGHIF